MTSIEGSTPTTSTSGTDREGRVFDLGYRRYDGPREGRNRARFAVYIDGIRVALGLGRGGRAKILPWLFISIAIGLGVIFAVAAGIVNQAIGEGTAELADLPSHPEYYSWAAWILFLFAAVVGPELVCPDRRDGVINLYLARPLSSIDYIVARYLAFLTVMLVVVLLPQIALFVGLNFSATDPGEYFTDHWSDIPRFLGAGAAIALYTTAAGLAVASFTTRRGYASVGLLGIFFISQIAAGIFGDTLTGTTGEWLGLISLSDPPLHINELLFDVENSLTSGQAARDLATGIRIGAYFAFTLVPIGILLARYRRLSV